MFRLMGYRLHVTPKWRRAMTGVALFAAFLLLGISFLSEGGAQSAGPDRQPAGSLPARPGLATPRVALVSPMPKADLNEPPSRALPRTTPRAPLHSHRSNGQEGRLAIVIDDIGHNLEAVEHFLALKRPLTFSILPAVPHTREAAGLIERAGREYLIHLPMQPYDYPSQDPGPKPLLLSQSPRETERRMRIYLETLPGAIGASNHMGSAFTYNLERMRVVQSVLAERHLFFLNSRTSGTPVPERIARRQGYPYLERDVFLDHDPSERAVRSYFAKAVRLARSQGAAIAIGHPYPTTLKVLRERLPRLAGEKVRIVTLSEMLSER